MSERIRKIFSYYARKSIVVRIPVLIIVAIYLFAKNLIKWGAIYFDRLQMRQRVAVTFALCLAIATVFPGKTLITWADDQMAIEADGQFDDTLKDIEGSSEAEVWDIDDTEEGRMRSS